MAEDSEWKVGDYARCTGCALPCPLVRVLAVHPLVVEVLRVRPSADDRPEGDSRRDGRVPNTEHTLRLHRLTTAEVVGILL